MDAIERFARDETVEGLEAQGELAQRERPFGGEAALAQPGEIGGQRVLGAEIVAIGAVARLEPWTHGDALLVLTDGSSVVLSRTHREAFLARWGTEG